MSYMYDEDEHTDRDHRDLAKAILFVGGVIVGTFTLGFCFGALLGLLA